MIDATTKLAFTIVENPGVYALLLGSGVSRSAEIPTGWDITLDLIRRLAASEDVPEQSDWAAWYRGRYGEDPGYSSLLDALSVTPAERRAVLHSYIEPTADDLENGRRVPTKAHHAIAKLVRNGFIKVIITTNFDRLLETALSAVGIEPVVIKSADDLSGASPLAHSRCVIFKVHGDYLDNRILNTAKELEAYPPTYDTLLDRIIDEYGLIVVGWSGEWDPALKSAIIRAPNRRYSTWWVTRGEPSGAAADIVAQRYATILNVVDSDNFFDRLADNIETLAKSRKPSPETVELLVASAKRSIARPERRVEFADLIADQTQKVLTALASDEFPMQQQQVTNQSLIERWQKLQGLGEPLARIGGIAGRWGNGTEFSHFEDSVRAIVAGRPSTGNSAYIGLAEHPGYLLFHTYALGLVKAERWGELHRWLTMTIQRPHREPEPASRSLFLGYWSDVEPDWWKLWPDLERMRTPWAFQLLNHVVPWSRDFGMTGQAAEENYYRLEILGGIASLENYEAEELLRLQDFTWMPYGRTMWDLRARQRALDELGAPDLQSKLFAAGFNNGSADHLEGVLRNIGFLSRRVGW